MTKPRPSKPVCVPRITYVSGLDAPPIDSSILLAALRSPEGTEHWLGQAGYQRIAGVDEVGRGSLAGPVVACACLLPKGGGFIGLADSKTLCAERREALCAELTSHPDVVFAISSVDHTTIDQINILKATLQAMKGAIESLRVQVHIALIDGIYAPPGLKVPALCVPKGDALFPCVSAASIIAKCFRDDLMRRLDQEWPHYGFAKHKGYGTAYHREQLEKYGPCPIHRKTFAPIRGSALVFATGP